MADSSSPPASTPFWPPPDAGAAARQREFYRRLGSPRQLQELFEYLPGVYFFVKDEQSRMIAASRSILDRFGLESETQLVGTTDFDYFPPHIADAFVRDDQLVMQTGQPMLNRMEIWYTEEGMLDWFLTTKLPARDRAGHVIGVIGTVRSYEGSRRSLITDPQIDEVVQYISQRHRGKITVTDLARRARLSPRQLHRRFLEVFGMSAQDFLTKTRIQAASDRLLRTDQTIASIAQEFGFCDQSAFTQQFKRHVGLTPLRFRRRHRTA